MTAPGDQMLKALPVAPSRKYESPRGLCVRNRWPDPPASEAYQGLLGDIISAVDPHTEADPVSVATQVLVMVGNVVGREPHYMVGPERHGLNLFTVQVGPTGVGRKGTATAVARLFCQDADPDWYGTRVSTGLSSGEGLIFAVRDPITTYEPVKEKGRVVDYQTVITDPGIMDKRLLIIEPEFGRALKVMAREGNTLSSTLRLAWELKDLDVLTKNSPLRATDAYISVIGHITRQELLRHLDTTDAANGFGNRILWVCTRRSKLLPDGGRIDPVTLKGLQTRVSDVVRFGRTASLLDRDQEARDLWSEVYGDLTRERHGLAGEVTSRGEAQTMRLASLYALLDCSTVIKVSHLQAALALWRYYEASAYYIFGESLGNRDADKILAALRGAPTGLTRTEIRDIFNRHKSVGEITSALGLLLEQGLARFKLEETGGLSAERWFAVDADVESPAA